MNVAKMLDLDDLLHELEKDVQSIAHNDGEEIVHYDDTYRMGVLSGMFRAIEKVERRLAIEKKDETQKGCRDLLENGKKNAQDQRCGCNS